MRAAAVAAIAAALVAGCGGSPGNTIELRVSGAGPRRALVVTENGLGSCNGGAMKTIASDDVLTARDIASKLKKLQNRRTSYPAGGRAFSARTIDGTVTWSESYKPLPDPLPRAELLALRLGNELCG
jgi:hypothetical protein